MTQPLAVLLPFFGPTSAADVAAAPGPTYDGRTVYVDEFDATYKWALGSAVAVDGYRVLGHTAGSAGRWILDSAGIRMAPSLGATWTTLGAAMVAMAYQGTITMAAEAWTANDDTVSVVNGTHLIIEKGATINGTIAFSPGTIAQNAIFYNNGGTTAPTAVTTLAVTVVAGATQLQLTSAVGFNVGGWFRIQNGIAYTRTYKIVAKVGNTVTIDRPVMRPFAMGANVEAIIACRDVTIEGNGVVITGQADAVVQYASAVNCHILDINASFTGKFGVCYDLGCRDSTMNRVVSDGLDVTPSNILVANAENIDLYDCIGTRAGVAGVGTGVNLFVPSCDNFHAWGGSFTICDGENLRFDVEDATDPFGTRGSSINGTVFANAVSAGILVQNGSSGNSFIGVESSFSQTGISFASGLNPPNGNVVIGGVLRSNTQVGIFNASGSNTAQGVQYLDNEAGAGVVSGGTLVVNAGVVQDTAAPAAVQGIFLVAGAGAQLMLNGLQATSTRNAHHLVETGASGFVQICGGTRYTGTGANQAGLLMNAASTARVDDFTVVSAGGFGIYLNNAAAYCRLGTNVNVSGAGTPLFIGAGAFNRGQATLNGAVAVPVAFGDTNAQDRFFWTYEAAGGAPAGVVIPTRNVGVGFSIVGVAGDTSLINYEIC